MVGTKTKLGETKYVHVYLNLLRMWFRPCTLTHLSSRLLIRAHLFSICDTSNTVVCCLCFYFVLFYFILFFIFIFIILFIYLFFFFYYYFFLIVLSMTTITRFLHTLSYTKGMGAMCPKGSQTFTLCLDKGDGSQGDKLTCDMSLTHLLWTRDRQQGNLLRHSVLFVIKNRIYSQNAHQGIDGLLQLFILATSALGTRCNITT